LVRDKTLFLSTALSHLLPPLTRLPPYPPSWTPNWPPCPFPAPSAPTDITPPPFPAPQSTLPTTFASHFSLSVPSVAVTWGGAVVGIPY
jgi:hypothetical protein